MTMQEKDNLLTLLFGDENGPMNPSCLSSTLPPGSMENVSTT